MGGARKCVFFFQAEDGIRDLTVTGVQTCALPISIDYISVAEPVGTNDLVFRMKVTNLNTVPPNSRWRIVWNWEGAAGQQYYVGMRTDASSAETFEYGHVATAVVGLVLGVPTETKEGNAVATATSDGLITITIPKSAIGKPPPGGFLGRGTGRHFTPRNPQTQKPRTYTPLEAS